MLGGGWRRRRAAARNLELDERVAPKFSKPKDAGAQRRSRTLQNAKRSVSFSIKQVRTPPRLRRRLAGVSGQTIVDGIWWREASLAAALAVVRSRLPPQSGRIRHADLRGAGPLRTRAGSCISDIKPDNLFLTSRSGMSVVKVLDFGISKSVLTGTILRETLPAVKTVSLMGTPRYMSPRASALVGHVRRTFLTSGPWRSCSTSSSLGRSFHVSSLTETCAVILEAPIDNIENHRQDLLLAFTSVIEMPREKAGPALPERGGARLRPDAVRAVARAHQRRARKTGATRRGPHRRRRRALPEPAAAGGARRRRDGRAAVVTLGGASGAHATERCAPASSSGVRPSPARVSSSSIDRIT